MPGDLEDLDLDDMALSSGEEEEDSSGSDMDDDDEEEMEMTDSELQAETIGSLFYRSYHPTFMDLCTEFADSEEFLIDGDALLRQTLTKEGITKGSASHVSLHIISLLERSLANFTERGGEFNLVFFKANQARWDGDSMLLLRTAVILHLRQNTNLTIFTDFEDPFDLDFQQYVETEKPSFFLSCAEKDDQQDAVYFLEMKNLGVNFADVLDMRKTLTTIDCWFLITQPSTEAVMRHVRMLHSQWRDGKTFPALQALPSLSSSTSNPSIFSTVLAACTDDAEKLVASALLVASTLQKHLGLLERVEAGKALKLADGSPLLALLEKVASLVLSNLSLATAAQIPDIQDTQFLLQTLLRLQKGGAKLTEIYSSETSQHEGLAADLEALEGEIKVASFAGQEAVVGSIEVVEGKVEEVVRELVPIDNPLYNTYTEGIAKKVGEGTGEEQQREFEDQFHWALKTRLSDDYDRTPGNKKGKSFFEMKGAQKAASFMVRYGTSIEGGIESDKPLAVVKKGKAHAKAEDPNKKSAKGVQIQRENIMKRFKESQEELMKKYKGLKEDATDDKVAECADLFEKKYKEIRKDIEQVGEVKLNKKEKKGAKEDTLDADVKAFFEKNLVKIYLKVLKTVMSTIKHGKEQEKANAMVQAMLTFKKLAAMDQSGEEKTAETLRKYILEIGFVDLAKNLKMVKEKEKVEVKQQRSFARFQLAHMGMHLDHDAPAERDRRVDKFNPDLWQRQLFDVVDHRESALIIAPTSSGKTYASYYAMETVLRESDEGTIVYVAPTKALVNQVSATVCARFSKRKMDLPPGRVVQGIYTRDFKENTLNCQILVTVPEGLEILLLSPERNAWAKSLRYVIFDEVHNIGAESRGETWEHIITLIRCPFLALSATVANPDTLHSWLQRAEKYKMERDIKDGCKEQRSYDVKLVPSVGKRIERHADLKKHVYRTAAEGSGSAELQPLHPIAALKPSVLRKTRSIPGHVTMAPSECLELYDALEGALGKEAVAGVEPAKVLGENFLKKAAVSDYNQMLKTFFLEQFMKDEAILEKLRAALKAGGKHSESSTEEDSQLTKEARYIQSEFPSLIAHLKEKNKLPCIVFTFNREYCNGLTKIICEDFEKKLDDTRMSDKYAEKQKAKEKLDAAEEKKQKKLQAKMDKIESKQGGDQDNKRRQQNDRDENEALKELNSVFKEFPEFTLVARNTLGDDDAEYIYNNLLLSDPLFQGAMKYGISWHHAGNNAKMRNATEMLFREKFLNVVIATTTLAQGIHMPCRSVVFAGDSVFLNSLNYHQCAGRAGRRGFDADGNVIFFGIKRSKISRLLTSNLPKIIGNNPTCLSLILRVFMMTSGHLKEEVRQDAISRALCLLENPLITSFQSNIGPRLKFYFMYCTDYLARQGLIDSKGDPVGFARLASHLHYHEPYNIAFCHLMQRGVLHTVCKKTELGVISEDTMKDLLILLNFLFGRMKLHIPSYQARKDSFTNSKVLLPPLAPQFEESLVEFNTGIDKTFAIYLNSAAKHYKVEEEAELPLSGLSYKLGKTLGPAYDMLSPFACLSGKDNSYVSKGEIQVIDSNVRSDLLADTIPKINLNDPLNGYVLDFYNHGVYKSLVKDNGVREGEVFALLKDFLLVLQTISTSLKQMAPVEEGEEEDLLVLAFEQLAIAFKLKFDKAFDIKKEYKAKGCYAIHNHNCEACEIIVESNTISGIQGGGKKGVKLRERFTCESSWVVLVVTCKNCKTQYVATCMVTVAKKVKQAGGALLGSKHQGHNFGVSIVDRVSAGNLKELEQKKFSWASKLKATDIDIN